MANNFDSNFTEKLMRIFLEKFESARVLSKNVNTQLLSNVYDPNSGDVVSFKRPTDFVAFENATGSLTGVTASDIVAGKASGVVQNYITTFVNFNEADQAIKMGQIDSAAQIAVVYHAPCMSAVFGGLAVPAAQMHIIRSSLCALGHVRPAFRCSHTGIARGIRCLPDRQTA